MSGFVYDGTDSLGILRFYQLTPFYPEITRVDDTFSVRFNDAYVFDYHDGGNKIKISNPNFTLTLDEIKNFYVSITINRDNGRVISSAIVDEKPESNVGRNVQVKTNFDTDGQPSPVVYYIDLAEFKGPSLEKMYLRDNIHWWMQVFEQLSFDNDNTAPVLRGASSSNPNSNRQFRAIAKDTTRGENIIEISYDDSNVYLYVSPHSNDSGVAPL